MDAGDLNQNKTRQLSISSQTAAKYLQHGNKQLLENTHTTQKHNHDTKAQSAHTPYKLPACPNIPLKANRGG